MRRNLWVFVYLIASAPCFAQPGPLNIGTINTTDSIVVYYDVSINLVLSPPTTTYIANRGTVTAIGGINVLTDDPDTAPNDSTFTILIMGPLPVTIGEFRAYQKNSDIELAWKILTEDNVLKYEVEKSANGSTFVKIGEVSARGGYTILNYDYLDIQPFNGDNFYRLKIIDRDGTYRYSSIVRVVIGSSHLLSLYPNPVRDKLLNVEFRNMTKGNYQLSLYNGLGQKVFTKLISHSGGSASEVVQLPETITMGWHFVKLEGNGKSVNKIILIQ